VLLVESKREGRLPNRGGGACVPGHPNLRGLKKKNVIQALVVHLPGESLDRELSGGTGRSVETGLKNALLKGQSLRLERRHVFWISSQTLPAGERTL